MSTRSDEVLDLLADEYAKEILARLSREQLSAAALVEDCDIAESTVYDRLGRLESAGLVDEELDIDPDGHHRSVYRLAVDGVRVDIQDGEYEVRLQVEQDPADRIAEMWNEVRKR